MKELSDRFRESCSAAILQGNDAVYVARVPAGRIMSVAISIGTRLPAFHTSIGRIQLGFLDDEKRTMEEWLSRPNGLILVTGTTGSGKSTTLASMIDLINDEREEHILAGARRCAYRTAPPPRIPSADCT